MGGTRMECHSELVEDLGNNTIPYRTVARCVRKFQQGRVSTSDEQRSRRSVSVQTWHVPSLSSSWMKTDDGRYWSLRGQVASRETYRLQDIA
ncbi:hypothetical protein TNCV_602881 [Trichonephila clavipes]|nr:hypothetical protein TNCV_602881 [Trichonephila clavipes]